MGIFNNFFVHSDKLFLLKRVFSVVDNGICPVVLSEIRMYAEKYGVNKVLLFGSRARGDYKRTSDIDLAFTGGGRNKARFILDVDEETSTLLFFDIVDLDGPVSDELRDSIRREGVVIYEKI